MIKTMNFRIHGIGVKDSNALKFYWLPTWTHTKDYIVWDFYFMWFNFRLWFSTSNIKVSK